MAYTIEVNSSSVKYKSISFTKKHPSEDCDTFDAVIDWSETINQFDDVKIKKNATVLFYGLIETVNPFWDKGQRYNKISGRCYKLFLWKKFTERYERGNIDGFFGVVNPSKLMRFLLRCPISEDPASSVFHRIGYGFDLNGAHCSAIRRDRKTHPEWCRFRRTGFCWRLDDCSFSDTLSVDAYVQDQREWIHNCDTVAAINDDLSVNDWTLVNAEWNSFGCAVNHEDCIKLPDDDDTTYLWLANEAASEGKYDEYFDFANLACDFIDNITTFQFCIRYRMTDAAGQAAIRIHYQLELGGTWYDLGFGLAPADTNYHEVCANVPVAIREALTIAQLNYCRLKIEYDACNNAAGYIRITSAWIHIVGDYCITWNDTDDPWLDSCTDETEWIEGRVVGSIDSYWTFEDVPKCKDTDEHDTDWRNPSVTTCDLKIRGKNVTGAAGGVTITPYIWDGAWQQLSNLTWTNLETSYVTKTIDVKSILNTPALINGARLKLLFSGSAGDFIRITCAYLSVEIVEVGGDYQRTDDWFKIDLGEDKARVMGVLFESRYSNDKYAVNYAIETATAAAPTVWTSKATKSTNNIRDILESWAGVTCRYIRIRITNDANVGWEISQVFVWKGEDPDYDINGDGTDLTIGAVGSANFDDYANAIDPISFGFQRLIEASNHICKTAHASYVPWEWWVEHNAAHDFHFEQKRGTDRSGTVIFQRGIHFESVNIEYTSRGTVQRARCIGRGEGKTSDEIASDWQVDAGGVGEVNTFYEKIISDKSVGDKTQADTLANVYVTQFGSRRVELIFKLSCDDPWEGVYEVGDEVKLIDASQSINAKFRVKVIERAISNEPRNETTLTLTNSWYDIADLWAEIKRELRNSGLTGTVIADWRGEGEKQSASAASTMDDIWNAQAQNEEVEPPPEKDDDRWNVPNDGVNSQEYRCDKDFFCIKGSKVADETAYFIRAKLMKDETFQDGWIDFDQNPRFVCEVKIPYEGTDPATEATDWRVGDFCRIWMHNDSNKGFGFTIKRASGGFEVWSYFLDAGGVEHEVLIADTMSLNEKFRLEARVDWTEKLVKWYYDNVLRGVHAFDSSETGNGTNLFPVFVYHCTSNPAGGVNYWAWLFVYDFRAQAVWEA